MSDPIRPTFFATPTDFRAWLADHHQTSQELWVGYYKKETGKPSITWPESVDQALCFDWIDGVRKSIDNEGYMIRFTPRKTTSKWSEVNIKRVAELTAQGLMQPAGLVAFEKRTKVKSGVYSYEQRKTATLDAAQEAQFQANPAAWTFFQAQPSSYRNTVIWWVVSAKKGETQQKRLETLIDNSAHKRRIGLLTHKKE